MRLEKIDLNLFVIFEALYQEQSVTRVAAQLNLTQPAISNALNRLRNLFDDRLFIRSPTGMQPTPVADNIIAEVRQALNLLGRSVTSNVQFDPKISEKVFNLGMNDLAEALILPELREIMRKDAPHITLQSYYVDRSTGAEDLKSGVIDLLLDNASVSVKEFSQHFLGELPYVVAMRKDHPLATNKISLDAYIKHDHLHVSSRRKGRGQMDIALHQLGYRRDIKMRIQSYLVAENIVKQTDLLWTAPLELIKSTDLHWVPTPFPVETLSWYIFWHKNSDLDPASIWIREKIINISKNLEHLSTSNPKYSLDS